MTSTKEVIDHHLKAFAERDLKGILLFMGKIARKKP